MLWEKERTRDNLSLTKDVREDSPGRDS
jgi:hypothetical protein